MKADFMVMHKDEKVAKVIINGTDVTVIKYTTGIWQPFHQENPTLKDIYEFLEDRCYENGRDDLKEILELANMDDNNPWEWVKKSHGVTYEDGLWIRFNGESLTWEEVRVR